jgi:hypothetical protein
VKTMLHFQGANLTTQTEIPIVKNRRAHELRMLRDQLASEAPHVAVVAVPCGAVGGRAQALTDLIAAAGEASLGDAESSLGDAESSLRDAESSLGDAERSLGDA